jgi:hypothetical protein
MERKYYIYHHISEKTGEIFYIGKGCKNRAYAFKRRGRLWESFYKKHGCIVVIHIQNLTEKESYNLEKLEIKRLKKINQCRANISLGGYGVTVKNRWWGKEISKAQIKRFKNNPIPKGPNNKTYKNFCENECLKEDYKTMNSVQLSKKYNVSVTTIINRLREIGVDIKPAGRKSIKIKCENDGVIFKSINDAARYYGVFRENIKKVLKGKYKHTNQLVFKYAQ